VSSLVVDGLIVLAAVFGWRAVRHFATALRALIIAITSVAFALAIVYDSCALMLIAAVILAEELYETGVVLLVLRRHGS
jgi:hypothetical protein